jgi:hypothetical protein
MLVAALDGRSVEVRRRWLPWRLRKRDLGVRGDPEMVGIPDADSLEGFAFGLVMALVWLLVGGIVLSITVLFGEALLLLLLLLPILAAGRMFWLLPWVIEASQGDVVLGLAKVRGWRDSEERIREIATAYQHGRDPFESDHSRA